MKTIFKDENHSTVLLGNKVKSFKFAHGVNAYLLWDSETIPQYCLRVDYRNNAKQNRDDALDVLLDPRSWEARERF